MRWFNNIIDKRIKTNYPELLIRKDYSNSDASIYINDALKTGKEFSGKGTFKIDNPIIIKESETFILSELSSNKGLRFWTDKPIDIIKFLPEKDSELSDITISGLKLSHKGNKLGKYAGIRFGGNNKACWLNKGLIDFDFDGNKIADSVCIDFASMRWGSTFYTCDILGTWKNVNTGLNILDKPPFEHSNGKTYNDGLNTLNLDVKIWGANTFYNIPFIDNSKLKILGHNLFNSESKLFYVNGGNYIVDQMFYDAHTREKGKIIANKLTVTGNGLVYGENVMTALMRADIEAKEIILR